MTPPRRNREELLQVVTESVLHGFGALSPSFLESQLEMLYILSIMQGTLSRILSFARWLGLVAVQSLGSRFEKMDLDTVYLSLCETKQRFPRDRRSNLNLFSFDDAVPSSRSVGERTCSKQSVTWRPKRGSRRNPILAQRTGDDLLTTPRRRAWLATRFSGAAPVSRSFQAREINGTSKRPSRVQNFCTDHGPSQSRQESIE